ncbi:hypothetical protein LP419_26660 [Massilia sp. H-1]|nr:hypothetical protein LP419_26660 [Massilia sp. H-1]
MIGVTNKLLLLREGVAELFGSTAQVLAALQKKAYSESGARTGRMKLLENKALATDVIAHDVSPLTVHTDPA